MSFHILGRSTDVQTTCNPQPLYLLLHSSSSSRKTWTRPSSTSFFFILTQYLKAIGIFIAPKRAPVEASSTGRKGKRTAVSRMRGTNKKTSDRQQASDSNQNTLDGAKRTTNKAKRPAVEASPEVRKKATFDRATFATPDLAQQFHLHFANRTVIQGRNIDFA